MAVLRSPTVPVTGTGRGHALLDRVPTQRPAPQTAPSQAPSPVRRPGTGVTVLVTVLAMLAGGIGAARVEAWWHSDERSAAARVSGAAGAAIDDGGLAAAGGDAGAVQAAAAQRAAAVASATQAADAAAAVLEASPHAGDVPRAQLQAATGVLTGAVDGGASTRDLADATSAVVAATAEVTAGEAAWQAAEAARVAAAQAAAEQAAAAARSAGAQGAAVRSGQSDEQGTDGSAGASAIGAGGKQCTAADSGAVSVEGEEIGAQINEYRISNGMPPLSVSDSSTLMSHALLMAQAGGIWHSGADNIVGCVSNNSAKSLVTAWSRSAPHNAQMLRSDVTAMTVGAASLDGWLYGAVRFS